MIEHSICVMNIMLYELMYMFIDYQLFPGGRMSRPNLSLNHYLY